MEIGESNYSPPEPEPIDPTQKSIRIRFGVFFDGTLNNRTNINQRLAAAPAAKLTKEELKASLEVKGRMTADDLKKAVETYNAYKANKDDEENSYEGYYTNVEKMERYISDAQGYQLTLSTYVEGSGTLDFQKDEQKGYAFAKGVAGTKAKVKRGLEKVVAEIRGNQPDKTIAIETLTLDVFGFSRGAAGARHFIHQALLGDENLRTRLEELGYPVGKVEVCFAGLYDTVSSYGYLLPLIPNNVRALNLDAVVHAQAVVHLAAADEHRKYFDLTHIRSAGAKGREIFLPGAHSDVGGGYRDHATERQTIYRGFADAARKDRAALIDAGWYQEQEITLTLITPPDDITPPIAEVTVERPGIRNGYSQIPLHLMAGYAGEQGININAELAKDEPIPRKLRPVQDKIQEYIGSHGPYSSRAEDWHRNDQPWLRTLRHRYFHFSARLQIGHTPRFKKGQRRRQTHDG